MKYEKYLNDTIEIGIKCDNENNPPYIIKNNKIVVEIFIKPINSQNHYPIKREFNLKDFY